MEYASKFARNLALQAALALGSVALSCAPKQEQKPVPEMYVSAQEGFAQDGTPFSGRMWLHYHEGKPVVDDWIVRIGPKPSNIFAESTSYGARKDPRIPAAGFITVYCPKGWTDIMPEGLQRAVPPRNDCGIADANAVRENVMSYVGVMHRSLPSRIESGKR